MPQSDSTPRRDTFRRSPGRIHTRIVGTEVDDEAVSNGGLVVGDGRILLGPVDDDRRRARVAGLAVRQPNEADKVGKQKGPNEPAPVPSSPSQPSTAGQPTMAYAARSSQPAT